jgi:pyruvate dehydrogenase E1 component beta subunit
MPVITMREALNQAMREEMARDPRVFLMGEEVGAYNGAYKVSQGLLKEFGAKRVIDTPIAEEGFAGAGIGAALAGLRPIVEMMTWNFAFLAVDQIVNNAAKMRYMSGGQLSCPVVFRGPNGAAHQLAAQHSHATDIFWCHVPGLKVVSPATPKDAKGLLKSAVRDDNPVIMLESETLYGLKGEVPENECLVPIGQAEVKREGEDVTIIGWCKTIHYALEAANDLAEEGVEAEVIDLRTLRPLDVETIVASVRKTNRVVVVQEGWRYGGVAAEVAQVIDEHAWDDLDAPVLRVTNEDVPMPYSKDLEKAVMPSKEKIVAAAKQALYR